MNKELERTNRGTFKKGVSGNPKGRPRSEVTQIKKAIASRGGEIIEQVIDRALAGDMQAAKILVDRLTPPLKPTAQPVKFQFDADAHLSSGAKKLVEAIASGQIAPDTGSQLLAALSSLVKTFELEELATRLDNLEDQRNAKKAG